MFIGCKKLSLFFFRISLLNLVEESLFFARLITFFETEGRVLADCIGKF